MCLTFALTQFFTSSISFRKHSFESSDSESSNEDHLFSENHEQNDRNVRPRLQQRASNVSASASDGSRVASASNGAPPVQPAPQPTTQLLDSQNAPPAPNAAQRPAQQRGQQDLVEPTEEQVGSIEGGGADGNVSNDSGGLGSDPDGDVYMEQGSSQPSSDQPPAASEDDIDYKKDDGVETEVGADNRSTKKNTWKEWVAELDVYKRKHDHCNVPRTHPRLGYWVKNTRARCDKLSEIQKAELDDLGFVWDAKKDLWDKRYRELLDYKHIHGDCNVPQKYEGLENGLGKGLGRWVASQRTNYDTLSEERKEQLNEIGFVRNLKKKEANAIWEKRFNELVDFQRKNKHCNVPQKNRDNRELGNWVSKQRQKYNRLSQEQKDRLDKIGFEWNPKSGGGKKHVFGLSGVDQKKMPAHLSETRAGASDLSDEA